MEKKGDHISLKQVILKICNDWSNQAHPPPNVPYSLQKSGIIRHYEQCQKNLGWLVVFFGGDYTNYPVI